MSKKFRKTLFLFRRDLRLEDNLGLIFALKQSKTVIPAFVFTPDQLTRNPYRSNRCVKFMLESLHDLEEQLEKKGGKLYFFEGKPEEIATQCIQKLQIDAIVINRDYTPYSLERDTKLEKVCTSHQIAFHSFDDALLHPPEETLKKDGSPYTIFTPYFKNISKYPVAAPSRNSYQGHYSRESIPFAKTKPISSPQVTSNAFKGGRKEGLKMLKKLSSLSRYGHLRDFLAEESSSHLSPYLKFTTCSPREVYAAICDTLCPHHELIRSLYWRDFFTTIAFFFPNVFKGAFHSKYNHIKWSSSRKAFDRWSQGTTGFPIVDAGMREMNETGFMHNRARMIVASFLVKDLHINWQWGEKYFAQNLIDYDPAVNNGNWQWVASTGCDAQPYFRVFNPWIQQKKFDPSCTYIKKWIPELHPFSPRTLHNWHRKENHTQSRNYPPPMVDHEIEAKKAVSLYKF